MCEMLGKKNKRDFGLNPVCEYLLTTILSNRENCYLCFPID